MQLGKRKSDKSRFFDALIEEKQEETSQTTSSQNCKKRSSLPIAKSSTAAKLQRTRSGDSIETLQLATQQSSSQPTVSSTQPLVNVSNSTEIRTNNESGVIFLSEREYQENENDNIFCKSTCTFCKSCICRRNNKLCCQKCQCKSCTNNREEEANAYRLWSNEEPRSFHKRGLEELEPFGPKNFTGTTPFEIFCELLNETNMLEVIANESNYYREWNLKKKAEEKSSKSQQETQNERHTKRNKQKSQQKARKKQNQTNLNGLPIFQNSEIIEETEEIEPENTTKENTNVQFYTWMKEKQQDKTNIEQKYKVDDIRRYIAISMLMSLIPIASYRDHWLTQNESSWLYHNNIFEQIMKLGSFEKLHQDIHFPLNQFEQKLNEVFKNHWQLSMKISIDEGMLGFRGRVKFKIFMPGKPEKNGLKTFNLCDHTGYCYDYWIYKGSESNHPTDAAGIVLDFMKHVTPGKHVLFADNWYGSEALANELNVKGHYFVLNCRTNRPTQLFSRGLVQECPKEKGKWISKFKQSSDETKPLIITAYNDRKLCCFISNAFDSSPITTNKQIRPLLVHAYNQGMGGVDLADFGAHQFQFFPHRRSKFTRVVFFGGLKTLQVNAWIAYRYMKEENKNISQKAFIESIVDGFLKYFNIEVPTTGKLSKEFVERITNLEQRPHCVYCHGSCNEYCKGWQVWIHGHCQEAYWIYRF